MNEQHFNAVSLIGDIVGTDKGMAVIRTFQETQKETYSTDHLVHMKGKVKLPAKASRVEVIGHFEMINEDTAIVADNIRSAEGEPYENVAHVIGDSFRTVQLQESAKGTKFANALLKLGDTLINGVVFRAIAIAFSMKCTKGSLAQIYGRVQHRQFEDKEGRERVTAEIICDEDLTQVIKTKELKSKFADMLKGRGASAQPAQAVAMIRRVKAESKPEDEPKTSKPSPV